MNRPASHRIKIQEAANLLGVSAETLRRWEKKGILQPHRTVGNQRYYTPELLERFQKKNGMGEETTTQEGLSFQSQLHQKESPSRQDQFHHLPIPALDPGVLHQKIQAKVPELLVTMGGTLLVLSAVIGLRAGVIRSEGVSFNTELHQKETPFGKTGVGSVLAAATDSLTQVFFKVNVPAIFKEPVTFEKNMFVQGDLEVDGDATFNGDVNAPNLVYTLTAGDGITITGGQNPTIAAKRDQNAYANIKVGSTTAAAGSATDTITFAAGGSTSVAIDTTNKKITFSSTETDTGWKKSSTYVILSTITDTVGIGTATPTTTLDVAGTFKTSGAATFSSTGDFAGALNLSGNSLTSSGDLVINPTGGGLSIGTGTAGSVDLAGGDLYVTGDLEVDGTIYGALSGAVTTSMTAGSVVFVGSSQELAADNSNFFFNDSTNRLGLGTNTPSRTLDVVGTASVSGTLGIGSGLTVNGSTTLTDAMVFGDAITDTLTVTGQFLSALIPYVGSSYDLGTSAKRWKTVYGDDANFTTFSSSTTTITGTTASDFLINTDNATADTEDATLSFERGTPATNAQFKWDSTNKYISTNAPGLVISADSTISMSGKAALIVNQIQSQDIFTASASGTPRLTLTNGGNLQFHQASSITTTTGDLTIDTAGSLVISDAVDLNNTLDLDADSATALTVGDGTVNYITVDTTTDAGDTLFTISGTSGGITTGKIFSIVGDTVTQGNVVDVSADGLSTGNGLYLESTSTALSSGNMGYLYWNPSGSTEIFATGDVLKLNVGTYGNVGYILNVQDVSSTVFGVSQSQITSALPHQFTAAGDVSIAYDLVFTNQTASYIKSYAPLYIEAGESFENNDLTLRTYGVGSVVIDSMAFSVPYAASVSGRLLVGTQTNPDNLGQLYVTNNITYGKALVILNQTESQDIFTASSSGTTRFSIASGGNVSIGPDTSPDYSLEINTASSSDPTFAMTDGDVAHGVTTVVNTDAFFHIAPISSTVGGAYLQGLADATGVAFQIRGVQSSDPTDTTPAISLIAAKASGTGVVDLAAAETVFQIANNDDTAALTVLGDASVGIGTVSPSSYANRLAVVYSASGLTGGTAGDFENTFTPTGNTAGNPIALQGATTVSGGSTNYSSANTAIRANASNVNNTGALTTTYGVYAQHGALSGGTTGSSAASYGVYSDTYWASSSTLAAGYNYYAILGSNSGTFTNTYGYYAGDLTSGTQTNTPFSFYASDTGTLNYFGGRTGIGNTAPAAMLDVDTSNIATYGKAAVIINHDEAQDLISASYSGLARFSVNVHGEATASGLSRMKIIDGNKYTRNCAGINSAIIDLGTAGGEVYLPEGTYTCTDTTITIQANNTTVRGAGWGTIIDASAGQSVDLVNTNAKDFVIIRDMQLKGASLGGAGDLIQLGSGTTDSLIENVYFNVSDADCIAASGTNTNNTIRRNNFLSCDGYGVELTSNDSSTKIVDNYFTLMGVVSGEAVIVPGNKNSITGNTIDGTVNSVYGIRISGSYNVVSNNYVEDGLSGIGITGTYNTVSSNTTFNSGSARDGIEVTSDYNSITGNAVIDDGGGDDGIAVGAAADYNIITGNNVSGFSGSGDIGISVASGAVDNYISGNQLEGNNTDISNAGTGTTMLVGEDGFLGIGNAAPAFRLDVTDSQSATVSAMIANTNTGTDADGLAIKLGFTGNGTAPTGDPPVGNRFLVFLNGGGTVQGAIDSAGNGAVAYKTSGADFAEYFKKADPDESLPVGTAVCLVSSSVIPAEAGIQSSTQGGVSACTSKTQGSIVGVISLYAGFVGGFDHAGDPAYALVGLVGQLPVVVDPTSASLVPGDSVAVGGVAGTVTKATTSGPVVGKALASWNPGASSVNVLVQTGYTSIGGTDGGVNSSVLGVSTTDGQLVPASTTDTFDTIDAQTLKGVSAEVLDTMTVKGLLVVEGNLIVKGESIFEQLATFINNVVFRGVVSFEKPPVFARDTAGRAVISKYTDRVDVVFSAPYEQPPVVTMSLTDSNLQVGNLQTATGSAALEGDSFQTQLDQKESPSSSSSAFLNEGLQAIVANVTEKGFSIKLPSPAMRDYSFNWIALAVKDLKETKSVSLIGDLLAAEEASVAGQMTQEGDSFQTQLDQKESPSSGSATLEATGSASATGSAAFVP